MSAFPVPLSVGVERHYRDLLLKLAKGRREVARTLSFAVEGDEVSALGC